MNKKLLFALWGGLFALCAALGFLPEPGGLPKVLMTALAIVFFLPGGMLLAGAKRNRDIPTIQLICCLSGASLALTAVLIIANFLSVLGSSTLGDALYAALVILSSPMVCMGNWLISLFLWACLLVLSAEALRKTKKTGR